METSSTGSSQSSFIERAHYERGFAAIYERDVLPWAKRHVETIEKSEPRSSPGRIATGICLIAMIWIGFYTWETGRTHLSVQGIAVLATLVVADLFFRLRRRKKPETLPILKRKITEAVCAHMDQAVSQRVAGQHLVTRRFVAAGLMQDPLQLSLEDVFTGEYRNCSYAICSTRDRRHVSGKQALIWFMQINLSDLPPTAIVAVTRNSDIEPADQSRVPIETHPALRKAMRVYAADRTEAEHWLDEKRMTALANLANEFHPFAIAIGMVEECLVVSVAKIGSREDPEIKDDTLKDPETEAHRLLAMLDRPRRIIDVWTGRDPVTGGRYRVRY